MVVQILLNSVEKVRDFVDMVGEHEEEFDLQRETFKIAVDVAGDL